MFLLKKSIYILLYITLFSVFLSSCDEVLIPKPRGYFRIEMPQKKYKKLETPYYSFDILESCTYQVKQQDSSWLTLHYPQLNADIFFTYFKDGDIEKLSEDARQTAIKHLVKADDITTMPFSLEDKHLHGVIYSVEGNTASSTIFQFNDSLSQFMHGVLYFNTAPNYDSLKPAIFFVRQDVQHFIETFQWKSQPKVNL